MHTINLVEKAYIRQVDYETTLETTVLENIVIRNGFSHNIHTHYLFCLVVLAVENSGIPLLLVTYKSEIFLYFHFYKK